MVKFIAQAPARPGAVLQKRGIERVHAILDAGEAILAESGYEAATLKAISERAGIPIASVYHYFADRHQVDQAILQRHVEAIDLAVKEAMSGPTATLADAVDAVIDPIYAYFRREPSCVELWFSSQRNPSLARLVETYDEATAEMAWQLAIDRGLLAKGTPQRVMHLAFEAGTRLFEIAFRGSPRGDKATIDEARMMMSAYLTTYAPS